MALSKEQVEKIHQDFLAEEKRLQEESDRTHRYEGYTIADLRMVWNKIKNPQDWKAPICVSMNGEMVCAAVAAIKYFTATIPTVKLDTRTMKYLVESEGYRNGPAGDH
jgi:hypothetical protein